MKNLNRPHFSSSLFTPIAVALAFVLATPLLAQDTGSVPFDATENALSGTYTCDGGSQVTINSVDTSTTDVSGSSDATGSNQSATACGLPLYSIASADDTTNAADTTTQDDGDGSSTLSQVSLLGGVVSYTSKSESDSCQADATGQPTCTGAVTIQGLTFAGQPITGTFTQPTTFQTTDLQVDVGSSCTGAALFTGQLTIGDYSIQQDGDTGTLDFAAIHLVGTLTCAGLPLTSVTVDLKDDYQVDDESYKEILFEFEARDTL
ncbi:hypothetical protein [Dyella caseinilytica]|uniref:Uncharacterized protein n=1 Tax=Dyella caseinilytica TaxID=1849581 RepID=A0ABX7GQQ7_9GAMM|nr:hypothetical protein [Dyella caseinilytica]QRN52152.1 hypothetical protein ISN74_11640 [Dyella caseinilytica]GGA13740.1 hypothetical protein GCM10011408_39050 [Dyella caseinilytica]